MTLQEIIDESRYELNNFTKPYRWQDSELVRHANDAVNTICRDAKLLIDPSTTATSRVTLTAPVGSTYTLDYALSALVIDVIDATLVVSSTDLRSLSRTNYALLSRYAGWRIDTPTKPTEFCLDYKTGYITFHPAPDAAYTVNLSVIRYPINALTTTSMSGQTPEIDAAYHPLIIDGILAKAFLKPGSETYDKEKAMIHLSAFRNGVARLKHERNLFWGRDLPHTSGPHPGFI